MAPTFCLSSLMGPRSLLSSQHKTKTSHELFFPIASTSTFPLLCIWVSETYGWFCLAIMNDSPILSQLSTCTEKFSSVKFSLLIQINKMKNTDSSPCLGNPPKETALFIISASVALLSCLLQYILLKLYTLRKY